MLGIIIVYIFFYDSQWGIIKHGLVVNLKKKKKGDKIKNTIIPFDSKKTHDCGSLKEASCRCKARWTNVE